MTVQYHDVIKSDNFTACFVNSLDLPIKECHICYDVKKRLGGEEIDIEEVYEAYYPHPEAPNDATISVLRIRTIGTYKLGHNHLIEVPAAKLFLNAKENLENIIKRIS